MMCQIIREKKSLIFDALKLVISLLTIMNNLHHKNFTVYTLCIIFTCLQIQSTTPPTKNLHLRMCSNPLFYLLLSFVYFCIFSICCTLFSMLCVDVDDELVQFRLRWIRCRTPSLAWRMCTVSQDWRKTNPKFQYFRYKKIIIL